MVPLAEALIVREENCVEERENRGLEKRGEVGLCLKWRGSCGQKDEEKLNAIKLGIEVVVVVLEIIQLWQWVFSVVIAIAIKASICGVSYCYTTLLHLDSWI